MKVLTLCVAAYNVESSIGTMIQSIIDSGDIDKIELIIVDDGSTDDTRHVVSSFLEKYPESIVYIEKENGGSGSARNIGIRIATGIYFKILDGDDKMDSKGLHNLMECLKYEPADLILTKRLTLKDTQVMDITQWGNLPIGKVINLADIPLNFDMQMHYMTIKTCILQDNHIKLTERISYVDAEFVAYTLPYINRILVQDYVVYIYYVGLETQSMNPANRFKKKKQMEIITLNIARYYQKFLTQEDLSLKKRELLEEIILKRYLNTLELYLKDRKSIREDYIAFDKKFCEVSAYMKKLSNRKRYIRLARMFKYRFYIPMHVFRVFKYQIYNFKSANKKSRLN